MLETSPLILVIDDEADNFEVVEALLDRENYQLIYLSDAQQAFILLNSFQPNVILLDVMMPQLSGIEFCQTFKSHPQWRHIPVIMVTALNSSDDLSRCLAAGADDFISKPLDGLELRSRVRSMLRINAQYLEIQQLCTQLNNTNQFLKRFNRHLEEQVHQQSAQLEQTILYDPLTHLLSRVGFLQAIARTLEQQAHLHSPFAILCLDCDEFKLINASLGHDTGDRLLMAIAERLSHLLRPHDFLARLGEDEFCFFLSPIDDLETLHAIANTILTSFNAPFIVDDFEIYTTACLGITLSRTKDTTPQDLLQEADTAMYRAKHQGKASYQLFDHQMQSLALGRLQLEQDMQHALRRHEFLVHYQPIINLQTNQLAGFEALVRWHHPEQGMVAPSEFISCAEETGLIVQIGLLVLRQACQQLQIWKQHTKQTLFMSVNLSVRQFAHPTLLEDIDQILAETTVDPQDLKLEITESAIMENPETAILLTQALRSRHIQLSIDDFGTGYSSLSYLSQFPVDNLKIDRSFINKIDGVNNAEIVRAIITLGHALGMTIVAEGIETSEQAEYLRQLGCLYGQGYFFSKPLNADQATLLLETRCTA